MVGDEMDAQRGHTQGRLARMKTHYSYIILGAGPAGLQLAYYLENAGNDYMVLERGARAGTFFTKFPRHGTLLSINKVHTGRTDREFNLRHDWNSLLTDSDEPFLFKEYSREYFPKAHDLVRYLNDFSTRFSLRVQYDFAVSRIRQPSGGPFVVEGRDSKVFTADRVIVATGLSKPHIPAIPGIELATGYEDAPVDPEVFADKTVLILGKGNSALETANNLLGHAAIIHLSSPESIKFAWDSHFVGHVRSMNSLFLDSYLLKSQNGILDGETKQIRQAENGKLVVRWSSAHTDIEEEFEQMEYDAVIRCTGFRMDDDIFDTSCRPRMRSCGRLPLLTGSWESVNVEGLFFAGTLMQSLDYKRSQSSFIHGFRNNIRTLARVLDARHRGTPLPYESVPANAEALGRAVIERANTTCSLWQQVGFLCDLIVLPRDGQGVAKWYRDLNQQYIAEGEWARDPEAEYYILMMSFGPCPDEFTIFNHDHVHPPPQTFVHGDLTTEIHPMLRRYKGATLQSEYHVRTDFMTDWDSDFYRAPLVEFLRNDLIGCPNVAPPKPSRRELIRNSEMRFSGVWIDEKFVPNDPRLRSALVGDG
jgi:thioredoxin reductase